METLFVAKDCTLERDGGTLLLRPKGGSPRRFPLQTLRHIVIAGEASMTSAIMVLIARSGVRMTILDFHGNVVGAYESVNAPSSGTVRLAQARHVLDGTLRMDLARRIVGATMRNLKANLSYRAYRGNAAMNAPIARISTLEAKLPTMGDIPSLMGSEGNARAWYYEAWPAIDARLAFGPRVRRPPNNRINCLISWFNSLCYTAMRHAIAQTHLEGCLSVLHSPNEARHSLALDLSEPFKPALTDAIIFEVVLRGQLTDAMFHEEEGVCRLSEAGRQATLELWTTKTETTGRGGLSLSAAMRAEALSFERHVIGISGYEPFVKMV